VVWFRLFIPCFDISNHWTGYF